jgi:hypothetical protein
MAASREALLDEIGQHESEAIVRTFKDLGAPAPTGVIQARRREKLGVSAAR